MRYTKLTITPIIAKSMPVERKLPTIDQIHRCSVHDAEAWALLLEEDGKERVFAVMKHQADLIRAMLDWDDMGIPKVYSTPETGDVPLTLMGGRRTIALLPVQISDSGETIFLGEEIEDCSWAIVSLGVELRPSESKSTLILGTHRTKDAAAMALSALIQLAA